MLLYPSEIIPPLGPLHPFLLAIEAHVAAVSSQTLSPSFRYSEGKRARNEYIHRQYIHTWKAGNEYIQRQISSGNRQPTSCWLSIHTLTLHDLPWRKALKEATSMLKGFDNGMWFGENAGLSPHRQRHGGHQSHLSSSGAHHDCNTVLPFANSYSNLSPWWIS